MSSEYTSVTISTCTEQDHSQLVNWVAFPAPIPSRVCTLPASYCFSDTRLGAMKKDKPTGHTLNLQVT